MSERGGTHKTKVHLITLIQVAQILTNWDNIIKFWQLGLMPGCDRGFIRDGSISLPSYGGHEAEKV